MNRFLALALVVLAVTPSFATGQQLPPPGDVDLSELRVENDPVTGLATVVTAVVYNNGTQAVYASVQFSYVDGAPLAGGQQGVDDTNARLLQPRSRGFINLTWVPPYDRAGDQTLRAVLRAQGDAVLTNNEKTNNTFVRNPAVNLTVEPPLRANLSSGTTGFLRYAVRNDGNAPDKFLVEVQGNASWNVRHLGEPDLVPPGQTRYGEIAYTAPAAGTDRNLTLRVSATSSQRGNVTAFANAPILNSNFTLPPDRRAISLAGLPRASQLLPGETTTFLLTLRNDAAADDVALVNVTLDANATGWRANITLPANATGWSAVPDANGTLAVALAPAQTRVLRLNVTRLENATVDATNLTVHARSNDSALLRSVQPEGEYAARLDALLLNATPEVALLAIRVPDRVYQGDRLVASLHVGNLGRLGAPAGTLRVELTDGTFALRQEEIAVPALPPLGHVNVTWLAETADFHGRYTLAARYVPNGTRADRTFEDNLASAQLLVRRPEIALRAPDAVDAAPGAQLVLVGASTGVSVRNLGVSDEHLVVRLRSDAAWLAADWEVDVPASGTVVLPLTVDVPRYPHVASVLARVHAEIRGRPEFAAEAAFTVRIDDVQGPDARLVSPEAPGVAGERAIVRVEADDATGIADGSVVVVSPSGERALLSLVRNGTEPTWWEANYTPTRPGTYVIEARLGDATAARHVTVLPNATWEVRERPYKGFEPVDFREGASLASAFFKLREVEPGTTASVEVDVGAGYRPLGFPYEIRPEGWGEGPHTLRVRATSLGGQTWTRAWNVTLDATPPVVSDLDVAERSGLTTVTVRASGATDVTARFRHAGGDWEAKLHPAGGGTFEATVRPPDGWTGVAVIARDAAGNAASVDGNENDGKRVPLPAGFPALALLLAAIVRRARKARVENN